MKIKNILLVSMLIMLFIPQSFGKEKKSLLQRIEEADSIPVYIKLTQIGLAQFTNNRGVEMKPEEIQRSLIACKSGEMPIEFNSLLDNFVKELNNNFHTTKFYGVKDYQLPYQPDNLRNVNDPEAKLIVSTAIDMRYVYDTYTRPIRRYDGNMTLSMILNGGFECNFQLFNFKTNSMKIILNCLTSENRQFYLSL